MDRRHHQERRDQPAQAHDRVHPRSDRGLLPLGGVVGDEQWPRRVDGTE